MKTTINNHSIGISIRLFPNVSYGQLPGCLQRLECRQPVISPYQSTPVFVTIKPICYVLLHLFFIACTAYAATPGLPFTEDFSSANCIRFPKTTANVSTEEQEVRLAWARRRYGALVNPPRFNISGDQDETRDMATGDVDGDGDLDIVVGNSGMNKLYLNTGLADAPFANVVGIPISAEADDTNSIALGDMDGDGDLDIVVGNSGVNKLYLNTGKRESPFAESVGVPISDDDYYTTSIALGDVDGDGDLDVVVGNSGVNHAYLNNGSQDPFADVIGLNISGDDNLTESIGLGDMDGDGDLDVVAGNSLRRMEPNRLYLNNGTEDPFAEVIGTNISEDIDSTSSLALGDVDGDGDLDVVAGNNGFDRVANNRFYLNNGSADPFANVIGLNLTDDADFTRSIVLGDIDSDGDLDVVAGNFRSATRLYLNNGTANPYANINSLTITEDDNSPYAIVLGDVGGDDDLDVVVGNAGVNHVFLNNSSENPFVNVDGVNISDDTDSTFSMALGDMDGDGDLDVISGNIDTFAGVRLYLNNGTANPFTNVNAFNISDDLDKTRSIALGDVDGDGDLDVVAGNIGNPWAPNRLYLNNGTANPFADVNGVNISDDEDETFAIALGDIDGDGDLDVVAGNRAVDRIYLNNGTANPFASVSGLDNSSFFTTYSIALGDVDGDGDLDVVVGNDFGSPNLLYLNNGTADPFANVSGLNISDDRETTHSIALGDVDGDGDLDVVAGNNRLYLNNGTENPFAGVDGINISDDTNPTESIKLSDIDGDGDLDVITGNWGVNHVYLNNGSANPFANVKSYSISADADFTKSIALGDVDGDGDLDVVAGNTNDGGGSQFPNRLYLNNGSANPFVNVTGLPITDDAESTASIAVGDVDGDGDLDVVAGNFAYSVDSEGEIEKFGSVNHLYLNNGTENPFADATGLPITADAENTSSTALGDLDGDGDLDVVAGNYVSLSPPNRVYLNNGTENPFANVTGLTISDDPDYTTSIALGDVDGDGNLDIVLGTWRVNRVYLNNGTEDPFANISGLSISDDVAPTRSIALGDIDSDGDLDVVVGNDWGSANRLYLNNGSEDPFANVTGLNISNDEEYTLSIAVGDVDRDGDLDVVAGNGINDDIFGFFGVINRLYLNNGSADPFADVIGLNIGDDADFTSSIALGDVDGDRDLDVIAGNSLAFGAPAPKRIYLNNGSENPFTGAIGATVAPVPDDTTALAIADIIGDGLMDVITGNRSGPNYVYPLYSHRLEANEGEYQTHLGTVESSVIDNRVEPIHSATLTATATIPLQSGIDYYLSNNDGQTWFQVQSGEPFVFPFPSTGSHLRWKAELFSLSPMVTPVLTSISITGNSEATDIFLSKSFIAENQELGAEVGTFEAIDIDGGVPRYSLVEGLGSDDNDKFIIEENVLKANAVFDFESKQSYTIRVRVTDEGGGFFEEQFPIGIIDASDAPTDISLSNNEVDENLRPGTTTIGLLTATDIDKEDLHIFNLPDGILDNALFAIDGTELKTNATFDYENQNQFVIRIRVTDGGGLTFEKEFAIMVKNVNDTATIQVISSPSDPSNEVGFGKTMTSEVFIAADDQENVNGLTQFEFLGPDGNLKTFERPTEKGVTGPVSFAPNAAGEWTVTRRWLGNDDVDSAIIEKIPFMVSKSDSILELFYLDVIQVVWQPRSIPGRLRLSNANPGKVDLSKREITITIQHPTKEAERSFTAKTDTRGNFEVSIPEDFFDEGEWEIKAIFTGDRDLNESNFDSGQSINVRQKPGYAILVQGSVESEEGLAEHDNTLNFVRETFEIAGFDTNLANPDIRVLPHNIPNPRRSLGDAIEEWAKDKMYLAPAPLYLVLVNHGQVDTFHMHPDELTPGDLDGMLATLEDGLSGLAKEQKIIIILGMCFSGSFIPAVSGENRIVITAAARDEFSIRGPGEDNERQGEFFVYQLFRSLSQGRSLLDSFQKSRDIVRSFSAGRNLAINGPFPSFPGDTGQHPLLDDNGDGKGNTIIPSSDGDGAIAARISLTSPVNSVFGLEISRVSPSRFLPPKIDKDAVLPELWCEIDENPEEVHSIWMQVKKLKDDKDTINEESSMQHSLNLTDEPLDINVTESGFVRGEWPRNLEGDQNQNPQGNFAENGAHQVFFFAAATDNQSEISEARMTMVYRASGDALPEAFEITLISPEADASVDYNPDTAQTSGMFTWEPSLALPDRQIEYIFRLGDGSEQLDNPDDNEETVATPKSLIFESVPQETSQFFLRPELVDDGRTYWWDVVAVDKDGNVKFSERRPVSIQIPNAPPVDLTFTVVDMDTANPIPSGTIIGISTESNFEVPFDDGFGKKTAFQTFYTISVQAENYEVAAQTHDLTSERAKIIDFQMTSTAPKFEVEIRSEIEDENGKLIPIGNPQILGNPISGNKVRWSVTSPSSIGEKIRYIVSGPTEGVVDIEDAAPPPIEIDWIKQVSLEVSTDGHGEVMVNPSSDWYNENTEVRLEAMPFENFQFTGWTGEGLDSGMESADPLILTMDRPWSIKAHFQLQACLPSETGEVKLNPGWNFIGLGDDFLMPTSDLINGQVWTYDKGQYMPITDRLAKGYGYFIYSKTGGVITLQPAQ